MCIIRRWEGWKNIFHPGVILEPGSRTSGRRSMARLADGEVEERLRRVLSLLSRSRWGLSEAEIARETGWGPQRLPLKSESVLTGNQPEEAHVDQ
jgi:hypothetical protein